MRDVERDRPATETSFAAIDALAERYLARCFEDEEHPVKLLATRDLSLWHGEGVGIFILERGDDELMIRLQLRRRAGAWSVAGELEMRQLPEAHPVTPPSTPAERIRTAAALYVEERIRASAIHATGWRAWRRASRAVCELWYRTLAGDGTDAGPGSATRVRVLLRRDAGVWQVLRVLDEGADLETALRTE